MLQTDVTQHKEPYGLKGHCLPLQFHLSLLKKHRDLEVCLQRFQRQGGSKRWNRHLSCCYYYCWLISETDTVECYSIVQIFNNYTPIWITFGRIIIVNIKHTGFGERGVMITLEKERKLRKCLLHILFNGVYSSYISSCTISNFSLVNKRHC